jgi:hypothetical protein
VFDEVGNAGGGLVFESGSASDPDTDRYGAQMRHNLGDYDEAVPHLSDLDIHAAPGMLCTAVRRITTTVPRPPQLTRQGFLVDSRQSADETNAFSRDFIAGFLLPACVLSEIAAVHKDFTRWYRD